VDLIQHVVAELIEVRASGRLLKGHVVRDDRDSAGAVGADERIEIRAVCYGVP